jgi:hypothetical protein
MLEIVDAAAPRLFIFCMSGGSTALSPTQSTASRWRRRWRSDTMLKSNIRVMDVNTVRHVSQMNGKPRTTHRGEGVR